MRVLTFNSHQPYIHLLATALPWTFGVVLPKLPSAKVKEWDVRIRPLPANIRLYPSVEEAVGASGWDWVLAHNIHDLLDSRRVDRPKAFLVHGTVRGRIVQDRSPLEPERYLREARRLLEAYRCRVVYISSLKSQDWGIPGQVILSGIDPGQYGGYHGRVRGIVQVANRLRERGAILGYETHREVCAGLPTLVLGDNPEMPGSRVASSWEDLKMVYRSHRVYLHTSVYPFEDGFNLALLEAMATGMPAAGLDHPTSPIVDGENGVAASTAAELREKVLRLLDDPALARRLGEGARETVAREFPLSGFRAAWQSLADELS